MSTTTDCGCETTTGCDCFGNGVTIPTGPNGDNGLTAYEVAVANGFVGTQPEWLLTLVGAQGDQGIQGIQGDVGPAGTITPLAWTDITLINGWVTGIAPNTAQYTIDPYGYIHFRGRLDNTSAVSNGFADFSGILTSNTRDHDVSIELISTYVKHQFKIVTNVLTTDQTAVDVLLLETVNPIYILD